MNSKQSPVIAIITDFGDDPYLGIMKGKILQINPNAKIISVTNQIIKYNVNHGAFILERTYKYFPENTIFLVVVDPGVGSSRQAIAAKKGNYYFIGPDNGILYPILANNKSSCIYSIPIPENVSSTFHGRDIFAPAAASLSLNYSLEDIGYPTVLRVSLEFPLNTKKTIGVIVFIDTFGNIITNIPCSENSMVSSNYLVETPYSKYKMNFKKSYFEGSDIHPFLIANSFGTFEITIRNGKASDLIDLKPNERIKIFPIKEKRIN